MRIPTALSLLISVVSASPIQDRQAVCRIGASRPSATVSAFQRDGVVPTVVPSIDPKVDGSFVFAGKAVNLGNELRTLETAGLGPHFQITRERGQAANTTYSIFLVDPDVPGPEGAPILGLRLPFLHWYVHGIKPCTSYSPLSSLLNTVAIFVLATPVSPQEQHRYTFLIYREPAGYQPGLISPQVRLGFQVNDYATRGSLTLVGGNFFKQSLTDGILPPQEGGTLGPILDLLPPAIGKKA